MGDLGIAVIGVGGWGRLVAEQVAATPGVELVGVADADVERATNEAGRLGVHNFESAEEVMDAHSVRATVLAVPNRDHVELARAAIDAGKHVLLEKPMALTVADAAAIDTAASAAGVVLMLDHIQRYFAPFIELHQLIRDGELGEVQAVSIARRDLLARSRSWLQRRECVGGLLYQSACHEYDLLRWFCGDAAEVQCVAGPDVIASEPLDYPDLILSMIRFNSGAVAQVWDCMTDPLMGYDGTVTGTEGSARFDLYRGRLEWRRLDGEEQRRRWDPPDQWAPWSWIRRGGIADGEAAALRALLSDFRDAVDDRGIPPITGTDGLKVVEMAQAGYLSIAERTPVALPLSEENRARRTFLEVDVQPKAEAQ